MSLHGTTIMVVRKNDKVVMIGDGQVTQHGSVVLKSNARKVRRIYNGKILIGFAGSVADAFTLIELFEKKVNDAEGNLKRACVDFVKDWRADKYLRNLEAELLVADKLNTFIIDGSGNLIEPEDDVIAIGSGGLFALSAGLAYYTRNLEAEQIAKYSMEIATKLCVYTNDRYIMEIL